MLRLGKMIVENQKNQIRKLSLFGSALREDYDPETSDIGSLLNLSTGCFQAFLV